MTCIICGKETGDMYFLGTKKDITVSFCREHIKTCMNCDRCDFNLVLKGENSISKK